MGFLSRKKPKPAPVEIEEQHPMVDELKQMEEAVPERVVEPEVSGTEELRGAGPVSDGDSPAVPENSPSSPPAPEASVAEDAGPTVKALADDQGPAVEAGMVRPLEYAPMDDVREIFEINFFGQLATIQAFCSLLRKNRGRILNITSVGVNLAIPFGGLLNASKCAFGMLSDTLRLELRPFGVRVIAIEPGSISTPAVDKTLGNLEEVINNLPPDGQQRYGPMIRTVGRRGYEMEKGGSSPDVVAVAVHDALTSNRPKVRYRVGKHAKLLARLPKILPESTFDAMRFKMLGLNESA